MAKDAGERRSRNVAIRQTRAMANLRKTNHRDKQMNTTMIETSWRKHAKSRKHAPTFTTNEFKERIKAICGVREPERHIDYELYPPAATSHRQGWMITVGGQLQDGVYPSKAQADRAARLEAAAQQNDARPTIRTPTDQGYYPPERRAR
jgi:hypothetical protein